MDLISPPVPALVVALSLLANRGVGQGFGPAPVCYAVTYDSIQSGFERQELAFTLKFRSGSTRGLVTTEDTTPVWQIGTGGSYWRGARDSLFLLLSNGQFELWMHLAPRGDSLLGWVEYRTDVEPRVPPRARMVAVRQPCKRP
jgi:hypothetical protein